MLREAIRQEAFIQSMFVLILEKLKKLVHPSLPVFQRHLK